jgi:hypothetical protein
MRLWSIHPKYLDPIGLVALWREALLARSVIYGKTKGYKNHPQLARFYLSKNQKRSINDYLFIIYLEAKKRGYKFNRHGLYKNDVIHRIQITSGQLLFETSHLKYKLHKRNQNYFMAINKIKRLSPHPLFRVVKGEIEKWEKGKKINYPAR